METIHGVEPDVPEENEMAGLPIAKIVTGPALAATKPNAPITAAQAKVEAIADLTHSAYQKAGTLNLTKEESEQLQADFPDEAFKPGAAGKENLIYIEHAFLRDRFIKVFGMGGWALIPRSRWAEPFITAKGVDGSRVYVEAMLVVRGVFVAESVGEMEYYPKNAAQNYGDAVEGATTAAFRRCAKNFGVGLQAWKKDWCDGWWKRKNASRSQPEKSAATKPHPPTGQMPRGAIPRTQPPAKIVVEKPKEATENTREWFLQQFEPEEIELVTQFAIELGWIMPNESIADLPLRFVPTSKQQLESFKECLGTWIRDGKVGNPYLPNKFGNDAPEVPQQTSDPEGDAKSEVWYGYIVPIPHKGQKRADYVGNEDTIGSLYEARHDDEEARRRLWGFCTNYEPKGWTGRDGKERPPSKTDIEFRAMLDAFQSWFEKTHPEEKL